MSTADLKMDLIKRIEQLKDVQILNSIQNFLDFELDKGEYKLSVSQKNRILEAKNDKVLSEEEANNEIDKWLSEK